MIHQYLFCLLLLTVFSIITSYSATNADNPGDNITKKPLNHTVIASSPDHITVGTQLHRSKARAPIYLECATAGGCFGILDRMFVIKLHPVCNPNSDDPSTHHKEIGILHIQIKKDTCKITLITLESSYQGKGYGPWALQTLVNAYKTDFRKSVSFHQFQLDVHQSNLKARKAFEKAGFQIDSTAPLSDYHIMMLTRSK